MAEPPLTSPAAQFSDEEPTLGDLGIDSILQGKQQAEKTGTGEDMVTQDEEKSNSNTDKEVTGQGQNQGQGETRMDLVDIDMNPKSQGTNNETQTSDSAGRPKEEEADAFPLTFNPEADENGEIQGQFRPEPQQEPDNASRRSSLKDKYFSGTFPQDQNQNEKEAEKKEQSQSQGEQELAAENTSLKDEYSGAREDKMSNASDSRRSSATLKDEYWQGDFQDAYGRTLSRSQGQARKYSEIPGEFGESGKSGESESDEEFEDQLGQKTSLDDFEQIYMKVSDTCAMDRLSKDVMNIQSRRSSPSPPPTPPQCDGTGARINQCPSVESFFKLAEKVTIHFLVLPGKKIYSKDIRLDRTIYQIKCELEKIVKVPAKFLELRRNKNLVMDYKTLKDCGGRPGKKMRFTVEVSKRAAEWKLQIPSDNKVEVVQPEVRRNVKIKTGKNQWKNVSVAIEFPTDKKLFIGGYRDKTSLKEFHHASSQTSHLKKQLRESQTHKSVQAFHETNSCMQTPITVYTQVDRPDYFVSCKTQKFIMARPYKTAGMRERRRIKAAITIQRYWRRWLAIRERESRMTGLIKRVEWAEQIRQGRTETRLAIKDDELYRQHNPTTLLDIELLYRAINLWRKQEVDYVVTNRWGAEKKAALADIMEKESDLLLDLERAKSKILKEKGKNLVENLYKKMGQPTRWLTRTGQFVQLDTPQKAQARTFHDLYQELAAPASGYEQRLALLAKLYNLIKNYHSVTSDYLVQLIGREITLMQRQARERLLVGLRKRILNAYFALCRDSNFNPEARILQKVPHDTMKLRKDMMQCKGCRRMLYRDQFTISRGVTVTSRCLTCMGLYRTAILRVDLNLYRRMLQELRIDEQQVESSVTYLIDAHDLQFLIEHIWCGQSALSGIDDRYLLRMCRWIKSKPWTPWNCVLLTEEEAVAHLHIDDMTSAYQPSFFEKVRLRHSSARSYFDRIAKTSVALDTNLQNYCNTVDADKKMGKKKRNCAEPNRKKTSLVI